MDTVPGEDYRLETKRRKIDISDVARYCIHDFDRVTVAYTEEGEDGYRNLC